MLELREVRVGVVGATLMEGLGLRARPGERVGLLGPSGSGKTTLLRTIAGLIDPFDGEVRLDEQTGDDLGWPAWRRSVTYVSQQPIMTSGTVRENLERPFRYQRRAGAVDLGQAPDILQRIGLGRGALDREARMLSVGQQQRVALVRALGLHPRVLLLDEPTGALDEDAAGAVEALIAERSEQGATVLVVTHDRAQAERWCTRTVDLRPYLVEPAFAGEGGHGG